MLIKGHLPASLNGLRKGYYTAASPSLQALSPSPAKCSNSVLSCENDHSQDHPTEDDLAPCPVKDPDLDDWTCGVGGNKGKKKNVRPTEASSTAEHQSKSSPKRASKQSFLERKNTVRRNAIDIPPPFLALTRKRRRRLHRSLYYLTHACTSFADEFNIQLLKSLAFEEISSHACESSLCTLRATGDIIALLSYVYTEMRPSAVGGGC